MYAGKPVAKQVRKENGRDAGEGRSGSGWPVRAQAEKADKEEAASRGKQNKVSGSICEWQQG